MHNKNIKYLGLFLFLGFTYANIVRYTFFCIPCFFNTLTGMKCPGCGITHMCLYLMRFDISNAFHANPFLFVSMPILLILIVLNFFANSYVKDKFHLKRIAFAYSILLVLWGIVRNIIPL